MTELPVVERPLSRKPPWLRVKLPIGENYRKVRALVDEHRLHTICQSGNCPNMGECWGAGTATFMILGNVCTRSCAFCAVATGRPDPVDWDEPKRVAEAIRLMGVKHAVITSVDRDDLKDCGSTIWAMTVEAVRAIAPGVTMETLIPDFKARPELVQKVIDVRPEVMSHNMETAERLTRTIRPQAKYARSLAVLSQIRTQGITTKSGIMLGLGETEPEVLVTMRDLFDAGVQVLTIGQYLQPTPQHAPVIEFVHPDVFASYKEAGLRMGFQIVESSPLVRSSYHAERHIL